MIKYLFCISLILFFSITPARNNHQTSNANHQLPTANRQPPTANRQPPTELNRPAFYKAMEYDDKNLVNAELEVLKLAPADVRDAFIGAMTMKKAGIVGSPVTKLNLFKKGHLLLEGAIKKNPENAEFRFLRLMIQEHAPGFLKYRNNITEDSELVKNSYPSQPEEVRQAMIDYSKKSKVLKLGVS